MALREARISLFLSPISKRKNLCDFQRDWKGDDWATQARHKGPPGKKHEPRAVERGGMSMHTCLKGSVHSRGCMGTQNQQCGPKPDC